MQDATSLSNRTQLAAGSRLESFIRRLQAQCNVLDALCAAIPPQGPVLELGLGNGRTYDHLVHRLPGRRIIAFDRKLSSSLHSTPPADDLVLGEIAVTARGFAGIDAALLHVDIGTGYNDRDAETLSWLPNLVCDLVRPGGLVASGLPLEAGRLHARAIA